MQLSTFLVRRFHFPSTSANHLAELLTGFERSGLAPPNMPAEVKSGEEGKLWAHVWEAMLYRHLSALGFQFRSDRVKKSGQHGPDFGIMHDGKTIWIEAVVPAPEGIPQERLDLQRVDPLNPGPLELKQTPSKEMLLRWTAVLRDKREKLQSYAQKGIIGATDPTVIAVNCCRLKVCFANDLGDSGWPFAVEAVFPIGPPLFPITPDGRPDGDPVNMPRYAIRKPCGAEVRTDSFLDPSYANVSAVTGGFQKHMLSGNLSLTLVHNPLAGTPLPRGILGAAKETVADREGDRYWLRCLSCASE